MSARTKPKRAAKRSTAKRSTAKRSAVKRAAAPQRSVQPAPDASKRIDALIADLRDWRGALLADIRRWIHQADPDVVEDWKWMGTPVWSHDGMYALANAHKNKVKITFLHGAKLADPSKLFNNGLDGSKWRATDLYEEDSLNERAFKALVRAAVKFNASHAVPKSKGSRFR